MSDRLCSTHTCNWTINSLPYHSLTQKFLILLMNCWSRLIYHTIDLWHKLLILDIHRIKKLHRLVDSTLSSLSLRASSYRSMIRSESDEASTLSLVIIIISNSSSSLIRSCLCWLLVELREWGSVILLATKAFCHRSLWINGSILRSHWWVSPISSLWVEQEISVSWYSSR